MTSTFWLVAMLVVLWWLAVGRHVSIGETRSLWELAELGAEIFTGKPPSYANFEKKMGPAVDRAGASRQSAYYAFQAMASRGGVTPERVQIFLAA